MDEIVGRVGADMSRRHEILGRLKTLREISAIMSSLKNISLMETRKISRFLTSQQQVAANIEDAAADFLHFYPSFRGDQVQPVSVYLLIGSERGFCGDFNQSLLTYFSGLSQSRAQIITVGRKLCLEAESLHPSATFCDGPGVAEEVHDVLMRLVALLNDIQEKHGACNLTILHHKDGQSGIAATALLPPFQNLNNKKIAFAYPPWLTLRPQTFFSELVRHYLFAALHEIFYTSLMAEHQQRARHLEAATQRLDEQATALVQKGNVLRQEEITEEIEEIMLGAENI